MILSTQATTCCHRYKHTLCVTNNVESLEFYGRCSLPSTALNHVDFTHRALLDLSGVAGDCSTCPIVELPENMALDGS